MIVNKVHYETEADLAEGEVDEELGGLLDDDLAERVAANFTDYQALAAARRAQHRAPGPGAGRASAVIRVPYLDEDVHDLEGLLKIDRYLFATEEQREALAASGAPSELERLRS